MSDNINSPEHYVKNAITVEPLELTGGINSCLGQALQYVIRRNDKHPDKLAEELGKAQFMFQWFYENELDNYKRTAKIEMPIVCCGSAIPVRAEVIAKLFRKRAKDVLVRDVLTLMLCPIHQASYVFEEINEMLQKKIDYLIG